MFLVVLTYFPVHRVVQDTDGTVHWIGPDSHQLGLSGGRRRVFVTLVTHQAH